MQSILKFYILISIPFASIILLSMVGWISGTIFGFLLFVYFLLYHPFISGLRLLHSNKISKKQFWKNFIPGWNSKYLNFLFFNLDK
jgi:hypothetical protein